VHSKSNSISDLATGECLVFSGKEQGLREAILDVSFRRHELVTCYTPLNIKISLTGSDLEFQYVGQVNSPKSVRGSWNVHAVSL